MKEGNWVEVYASTFAPRIDLMRSLLTQHNIRSIVLNQQDSNYLAFGEIRLFVEREQLLKAKRLLSNFGH